MKKTLLTILLACTITACSSNNNSGTSENLPAPSPTPYPNTITALEKFTVKSIGPLVANSAFSMQASINNADGTVNTSYTSSISLQAFTDNLCSIPTTINGSNSAISANAKAGIGSFSDLVFNYSGTYYLKFSGNNVSQCGHPLTVSEQVFPLNIKNLSFYVGTYSQVVITFSQSDSEDKPSSISVYLDKTSDSYVSYPIDDNSLVSDDLKTRTYSFEFTDYNLSLQQAASAYLQIQTTAPNSTLELSDKTIGVVAAPRTTASKNNSQIIVEVKESQADTDHYATITVYAMAQWALIQSGKSGEAIFSFTSNQSNSGTIYFIGNFTDYNGTYNLGTNLHATATTVANKTVDLGDVVINKY